MKRLFASLLGAALLLGGAIQAPVVQAVANPAAGVKTPDAAASERIWPDERIYFIMIDRFYNGDKSNDDARSNPRDLKAWHGGDIQGIIDKLPYIKSMGFTAIWITPHVKNSDLCQGGYCAYHGYHANDFFETDPRFGTTAKVKELVDKAHAQGLKVLFDIVVNHGGPDMPLYTEHPDWFNPKVPVGSGRESEINGWFVGILPDLDQSRPETRDYILKYSRHWIEQTGVDGFRLDTVKHVPKEFFTWYSAELQKIKPGFWLLGEVWTNSPFLPLEYQKAGVQAMLDFPVSETARAVFAKDGSMSNLASMVSNVGRTMDDPYQMAAFLDNHDMARFMSEAKDEPDARLKLGLTFLFTQRSIPTVYYGTEIGMHGKNDPYNREDFPWGQEQNHELVAFIKKLNEVRAGNIALRRGAVENLTTGKTYYAFARVHKEQTAVVVLNNDGAAPFREPIDVSGLNFRPGTVLTDVLTGKKVKVDGANLTPDVAARSGAIYVPAGAGASTSQMVWLGLAAVAAAGGTLLVYRLRNKNKGR